MHISLPAFYARANLLTDITPAQATLHALILGSRRCRLGEVSVAKLSTWFPELTMNTMVLPPLPIAAPGAHACSLCHSEQ